MSLLFLSFKPLRHRDEEKEKEMKEDITSGTKRKKDNKDVPLVNKRIKEREGR